MSNAKALDINSIKPYLKRNDVEFAAVFGSYAKGKNKPESDLDLLVSFSKPKGLFDLVRMENELSEILQVQIDLVTRGSLSPYMREDVLSDLEKVYEKR